jgi:acyl transferase domain-containing protein
MVEEQGVKLHDYEFWLGYSLGEVIAATIAGWFDLDDAIKLARARSIIMQKHWPTNFAKMMICMADSKVVRYHIGR